MEMARTGRLAMTRAARSTNGSGAIDKAADSHDPTVSYSV
jgi:hypothetical protein